ncbi:hypothetical protein [Streptomyces sp. NPDC056154]|uniref:hypothetical protein n=1 Tax=unclassified Streptomyces TaxID=2593676 RepID=UPI0035D8CD12
MTCLLWRDEHLIAYHRRLAPELDAITDADQRQLLERYTRRHVTRRLRDSSAQAPMPANSFLGAKQHTILAVRFLQWPADRGRQLNSSPSTMSTPDPAAAPAPAATPTTFSTAPSNKGWSAKSQSPGDHTATTRWPARRTTSKRFALSFSTRLRPPHMGPSASCSALFGQPVSRIDTARMDEFREGRAITSVEYLPLSAPMSATCGDVFHMLREAALLIYGKEGDGAGDPAAVGREGADGPNGALGALGAPDRRTG